MKVDVVNSSREMFGADRSAVQLTRLLRRLGHDVSLVVPEHRPERGITSLAAQAGLEVRPTAVVVASSRGVDGVRAFIRSEPRRTVDVTIFNTSAVLAARGSHGTRVLILREWIEPGNVLHRVLARFHSLRMSTLVGVSSGVVAQWRRVASLPALTRVIPNSLSDEWLDLADEPLGEKRGILCLGRFNQWKGQHLLAEAYTRAFQGPDRPKLVFLGGQQADRHFGSRSEQLARAGVHGGWEVLPFTPHPQTRVRLAALVVVPSLRPEPFGLVLLEALALGCKVIAFEDGGPNDIAPYFSESVTLVPRTVDALANELKGWWADGGQGQTSEQQRVTAETLRQHYSSNAIAGRWDELLTEAACR